MARSSLRSLLILGICSLATVYAQLNSQLVGTWTTKSGRVLTGPEFYDPNNDIFLEPTHTGVSYSFTSDGFYEEAYYRAASNPTKPSCPEAVLQFQHGTVTSLSDGSLSLSPFAVDGRQLVSSPCAGSTSTYTRYNQSEVMKKWQVYTDPYSQKTRLDLYRFDGAPMIPMYLVSRTPAMNPTITMNPIIAPTATPTGNSKRHLLSEEEIGGLQHANSSYIKRAINSRLLQRIDPNVLWWVGISLVLSGGVVYLM